MINAKKYSPIGSETKTMKLHIRLWSYSHIPERYQLVHVLFCFLMFFFLNFSMTVEIQYYVNFRYTT